MVSPGDVVGIAGWLKTLVLYLYEEPDQDHAHPSGELTDRRPALVLAVVLDRSETRWFEEDTGRDWALLLTHSGQAAGWLPVGWLRKVMG